MSDDLHEDGPLLHEVIHALEEELAAANADRARLLTLLDVALGEVDRYSTALDDVIFPALDDAIEVATIECDGTHGDDPLWKWWDEHVDLWTRARRALAPAAVRDNLDIQQG